MTVLVSQVKQMISEGAPIQAVVCASTGDTSAALAVYCAAAGIPSIVLLPKGKISFAQLVQPIANGSLVLSLDTDFDGCMRVVQEITRDETLYLANSMNSLRIEGQKTVGIEIVQQFDWAGAGRYRHPGRKPGQRLRPRERAAHDEGPGIDRQAAADRRGPRRSTPTPLYRSYLKKFESFEPVKAEKTLASAIQIGNPVSVEKAIRTLKRFDGVVMDATEQELADAAALGDRTGMFNCPHTGVALAAMIKLLKAGQIDKAEQVVVISTANGLKFADFKVGYHEGTLGFPSQHSNRPIEVSASVDAVKDALQNALNTSLKSRRNPNAR